MQSFDVLRRALDRMVKANSWEEQTVHVRVKTLTPEEAIGNPEHQDYPLVKGRERMMEAKFLGSRGQAFTDMYGDFSGTLREVAAMEIENNYRRAVFLATLNALSRHLGLVTGTVHCRDDQPPLCAKELTGFIRDIYGSPRIALVGLQPRMVPALAQEFEVRVSDMDPDNVGTSKFGVHIQGPEDTVGNIDWCELALITGTTLTNDTLSELVTMKPLIVYGVTAAAAAHFLELPRFCPYGT
jgi:hypothetical protein